MDRLLELGHRVRDRHELVEEDLAAPVDLVGRTELLESLAQRYGAALPPVYITENGCSYDGIDDRERIDYLAGHIAAMRRAEGVDVRGYFVWSLLDNFEWAEGYHQRFGLVHVDFDTLERVQKASYKW